MQENFDWNTGSYLSGKNAKNGEKVTIASNARKEASNFKDKNGNDKMDILVDLEMSDGDIKTLRLTKKSQVKLKEAGYSPMDCKGATATIMVKDTEVAGEDRKTILLVPDKNPLS